MTWVGKTVINIDTMIEGKVIGSLNNYTHSLYCAMEDGTTKVICMNNICSDRDSEIASNEEYKMMFWLDYGKWMPFADLDFVKDPKQFWKNYAKLDPSVRDTCGYKLEMGDVQ